MINNSVLKFKSQKLNEQKMSIRASSSYESAQSIGILFTTEDVEKHDIVKHFIDSLKKDGKKVHVFCFLPKGKDNYEFLFSFFKKEEIGLMGQIKNETLVSFLNQNFDFLFLLDKDINPFSRFLLANSNAKCRVGLPLPELQDYLELMINPKSKSYTSIVDNFLLYIKNLR